MPEARGRYGSWSRLPFPANAFAVVPADSRAPLEDARQGPILPFGAGRTYGDTCVNPGGGIVDTRRLRGILAFDPASGVVRCAAGTTLGDVLEHVVPSGWFPPVCPGTKHVTIGGAIAHDVHGKNQPATGTFGCHVQSLDLLRSSGERLRCAPDENDALFRATIGGLGLTGLILSAELRLRRVATSDMDVEKARCADLAGFLASPWPPAEFEYGWVWVDCLGRKRPGERCVLQRANHAASGASAPVLRAPRRWLRPPGATPALLFNRATLRVFNRFYYTVAHRRTPVRVRSHFDRFLFPQDGLHASNRLYGARGVYAYHCLIPSERAPAAVPEILERVSRRGEQSLLTVLKPFGDLRSPGMLSFSGRGISLLVGFPNEGRRTLDLLAELDAIVAASGGRLYPAKDARMPPAMFRLSFPRWEEFARHVDPRFSSSFWRRVTSDRGPAA